MNLQDFACKVSYLIWGGDLGWDRPGGLEALYERVRHYHTEATKRRYPWWLRVARRVLHHGDKPRPRSQGRGGDVRVETSHKC